MMAATPSETSERSEDRINDTKLPSHWKVYRSESYAPGRVYYFNCKNRCSVWNIAETKLKINNIIPKNANIEKVVPIEPSESPDGPARLESRPDDDKHVHKEQSAAITQGSQSRSTNCNPSYTRAQTATHAQPVAFTPETNPKAVNPNIWPVPSGNGQTQSQNHPGMPMYNSSMLPNLPPYGPIPGYPPWGYPYQSPFVNHHGFSGNVPNIAPYQFGSQANLGGNIPPPVMYTAPWTSNTIPQNFNGPAPTSSTQSNPPNMNVERNLINSGRLTDSKERHSEHDSPEATEGLLFEEKKTVANRFQQKPLRSDDLRTKLKELHRKRRRSIDGNEDPDKRQPRLHRTRRLSCPSEVDIPTDEPVNEGHSTDSNDDEDPPPAKGESYGFWLLKSAKPGVCTKLCYIAVDTNIFINHLNLVKSLIEYDTDNICRILVPWRVNNELGHLIKNEKLVARRIRTRHANRFVREELGQSNSVLVVQSPMEASKKIIDCNGPDDEIVNCCLQYDKKNLHVILLTDDTNLSSKIMCSGIKTYRGEEMKKLLNDVKDEAYQRRKLLKVKIIIPNTLAKQSNEEPSAQNQISVNNSSQNSIQNPHTMATNFPVQPSFFFNCTVPPPIVYPASFNPSIPPPNHYIPNEAMTNAQPSFDGNNSYVPLDTFAANMMSSLNKEERVNNTERNSVSSSRSSSTRNTSINSNTLLAMPVQENKTEKREATKTPSKVLKKIIWDLDERIKDNSERGKKKIVLQRSRWNSTADNSESIIKSNTLKKLPEVPKFTNTDPLSSLPVTVPSMSSNYATSSVSNCALQSTVNQTETNEPPSLLGMHVDSKKTNTVLKPDMWVSKRTQQMVMDSQKMNQNEDRTVQEPKGNQTHGFKRFSSRNKKDVRETRSNEAEVPMSEHFRDLATDKTFKRRLLLRMDEWTCILVQTMEHVLSFLLQQDPCGLASPWGIQEAVVAVMDQQLSKSNQQASDIARKLVSEITMATRTTTRGRCTVNTTLPSTAEQFLRIHECCVQLLTALKESTQNPEIEMAESNLSALVSEIKKGEIDVLFDNLDATQENRDEKLDKHTNNEDEEDFIENRCEDVDINAEIIDFLKKHYVEWSSYDENVAQNKNVLPQKGGKKFNQILTNPTKHPETQAMQHKDNVNKKCTLVEVVNNKVSTKQNCTLDAKMQGEYQVEPKIIRNLNIIPEFEARCNLNNRDLEEFEWDSNYDEEYHEEGGDEQDDGWDKDNTNDNGHNIDRDGEILGDEVEHMQLATSNLQKEQKDFSVNKNKQQNTDIAKANMKVTEENEIQKYLFVNKKKHHITENAKENKKVTEESKVQKDLYVNKNKQHNAVIAEDNMKVAEENIKMVENTKTDKKNTKTMEESNDNNTIKCKNIEITKPMKCQKQQKSNKNAGNVKTSEPVNRQNKQAPDRNVALVLRLSFLNVYAYCADVYGEDKNELTPDIIEGNFSGSPEFNEVACLLDRVINNLTRVAESRPYNLEELHASLQRLTPQCPLPSADNMRAVFKDFDKEVLKKIVENMEQEQRLMIKISRDPNFPKTTRIFN